MANSYVTLAKGILPAVTGSGSKVPGAPMKIKLCQLTYGDVYPDGGIAASTLETALGFTHIDAIVPCGGMVLSTGIWLLSWSGVARTLQIFANPDYTGAAMTVGTIAACDEIATNDGAPTDAVGVFLAFGY